MRGKMQMFNRYFLRRPWSYMASRPFPIFPFFSFLTQNLLYSIFISCPLIKNCCFNCSPAMKTDDFSLGYNFFKPVVSCIPRLRQLRGAQYVRKVGKVF